MLFQRFFYIYPFLSDLFQASEFYEVSHWETQLILQVSYSLGIPCCLAATFILSR